MILNSFLKSSKPILFQGEQSLPLQTMHKIIPCLQNHSGNFIPNLLKVISASLSLGHGNEHKSPSGQILLI